MMTQLVAVASVFSGKKMWEIRREGILIGTVHKETRAFGTYRVLSHLSTAQTYTNMAQVLYAIESL